MNLLSRAREALIRYSLRRAARHLATADADTLMAGTRERVLRIFQSAAKSVPAYRHLLEQQGVSVAKVDSLETFHRHVPEAGFPADAADAPAGHRVSAYRVALAFSMSSAW